MAASAERVPGKFVDWIGKPGLVAGPVHNSTTLNLDEAGIIAGYVDADYVGERIGAFARNFWEQRGIDPGRVRPINPEFYQYWDDLDPVDSTRRVSDTHHWPVWIPAGLSLATLERAGLRLNFNGAEAFQKHRNTPTRGEYYAVMRKEILGRNLPEAEQIQELNSAGYPGLAEAADITAVIFAINQHDGSRWLGNNTGAENRSTYTRCVERVAFDKRRYTLVVGCSAPSGVCVAGNYYSDYDYQRIGVAALRRF